MPRSPMINSRWPRPIGIIESIAVIPVASVVSTDLRATTFGAITSTGRIPGRRDRALAVDGFAKAVDDPADQRIAHRHRSRPSRSYAPRAPSARPNSSSRITMPTVSSSRFSASPEAAVREPHDLTGHDAGEPERTRDAIVHLSYGANIRGADRFTEVLYLLSYERAYLIRANCHLASATSVLWRLTG